LCSQRLQKGTDPVLKPDSEYPD